MSSCFVSVAASPTEFPYCSSQLTQKLCTLPRALWFDLYQSQCFFMQIIWIQSDLIYNCAWDSIVSRFHVTITVVRRHIVQLHIDFSINFQLAQIQFTFHANGNFQSNYSETKLDIRFVSFSKVPPCLFVSIHIYFFMSNNFSTVQCAIVIGWLAGCRRFKCIWFSRKMQTLFVLLNKNGSHFDGTQLKWFQSRTLFLNASKRQI